MIAVAYLSTGLAVFVAVLLAIALRKLDRTQQALVSELESHEKTRTEFRAVVLEADRNAERVADLDNRLWAMEMWPLTGAGPDPIYRAAWEEVYAR